MLPLSPITPTNVTALDDALVILERAMDAALDPIVPQFNSEPARYFQQAPLGVSGALLRGVLSAALVYQSQDGGGNQRNVIGRAGWSGLITIRVISLSKTTAAEIQAAVPTALTLLSDPGVTFDYRFVRPLALLPQDTLHTDARQWLITIRRAV